MPFPSPEDLPYPGIKPASPLSPALQADSLPLELSGKTFYITRQKSNSTYSLPLFPNYAASSTSGSQHIAGASSLVSLLPVSIPLVDLQTTHPPNFPKREMLSFHSEIQYFIIEENFKPDSMIL